MRDFFFFVNIFGQGVFRGKDLLVMEECFECKHLWAGTGAGAGAGVDLCVSVHGQGLIFVLSGEGKGVVNQTTPNSITIFLL